MSLLNRNKAKLMKARLWAKREFENDSVPQNRTIKNWILRGDIKGKVIGRRTYVYEDQYYDMIQEVSDCVSSLIAESVIVDRGVNGKA
ncbi:MULTISPECIES: hypothetical protein [Shewanella]|uniref:Uncharacterized protein n=1 Tax=Shewanella insulae TaxID=2681496 RepID=A0A6L7I059_9GAMM|nr:MULTISPECIES: hypothetical protein [Shewanella]MCG9745969.1 hypothetical protein [Shewanella sp. Isolate8]MXR69344.1 hypothetical protein [Shewanella insulae]